MTTKRQRVPGRPAYMPPPERFDPELEQTILLTKAEWLVDWGRKSAHLAARLRPRLLRHRDDLDGDDEVRHLALRRRGVPRYAAPGRRDDRRRHRDPQDGAAREAPLRPDVGAEVGDRDGRLHRRRRPVLRARLSRREGRRQGRARRPLPAGLPAAARGADRGGHAPAGAGHVAPQAPQQPGPGIHAARKGFGAGGEGRAQSRRAVEHRAREVLQRAQAPRGRGSGPQEGRSRRGQEGRRRSQEEGGGGGRGRRSRQGRGSRRGREARRRSPRRPPRKLPPKEEKPAEEKPSDAADEGGEETKEKKEKSGNERLRHASPRRCPRRSATPSSRSSTRGTIPSSASRPRRSSRRPRALKEKCGADMLHQVSGVDYPDDGKHRRRLPLRADRAEAERVVLPEGLGAARQPGRADARPRLAVGRLGRARDVGPDGGALRRAIRITTASCCRRTGKDTRSGRTTSSPPSTTGSTARNDDPNPRRQARARNGPRRSCRATSRPTSLSSTWGRSTRRRTACFARSCGRTARSCSGASR